MARRGVSPDIARAIMRTNHHYRHRCLHGSTAEEATA